VDGLGHYSPDRSEDLWGRGANFLEWRCITESIVPTEQVGGCKPLDSQGS